jgi:FAD/FMN-containing dehydrogenase
VFLKILPEIGGVETTAVTLPIRSWGLPPRPAAVLATPENGSPNFLPPPPGPLLVYGLGRSYGDVCLNQKGFLIQGRRFPHSLSLDAATGKLRAGAGATLDEILTLAVPQGWFLPVTPGTRFVTVGGAIANDVHGKNHHRHGTFGRHVLSLQLARSDRPPLSCSSASEPDLFRATIGGMGLTGAILWAEIQLQKIDSPWITTQTTAFHDAEEMFDQLKKADAAHQYTVAWLDGLSFRRPLETGLLFAGDHAAPENPPRTPSARTLRIPFNWPEWTLNRLGGSLANQAYRRLHLAKSSPGLTHYRPFFYPLDGLGDWNRCYGKRGFYQFQCVFPQHPRETTMEFLRLAAREKEKPWLVVLKTFGDIPSPGLMSFPRAGMTLCLDYPNRGPETAAMLRRFHDFVRQAGGRLYSAKDAVMTPEDFAAGYPQADAFAHWVDPAFGSDFWRRVKG